MSDPKELARALQIELARVGCEPGTPDGVWGSASQQAIRAYNSGAGTRHDDTTPSLSALADVRAHSTRVCLLKCEFGYKVVGETCVIVACSTGQIPTPSGECVAVPVAPPPDPRNCTRANGTQVCDR